LVLRAYEERCAVSGLKFINGLGRAEVVAAHIRPVERNGPDAIQNGIALSTALYISTVGSQTETHQIANQSKSIAVSCFADISLKSA